MAALNKFLAGLTPAPFVNSVDYDGLEYKWKFLVFRPALFKNELYLLSGLLFYIAFILYGVSTNAKKAKAWFNAHLPILQQQFSRPLGKNGLTADGYTDLYNFSTGRRNVATLHTAFTLRPRHDLFQWAFQVGRTFVDLHYQPKDDVQLDFTLLPGALPNDLVWAVVAKDELRAIKKDRWDLTFTRTTEHPDLAPTLSVMSEFADVTDNILKPPLISILNDPKVLPYFRSLSVTDQPRVRPAAPLAPDARQKHVILSLAAPPPAHASATVALVSALFPLIDTLAQLGLRPETKAKLKRVREQLDKDLKEDAEREKKEELSQAADDKKAAKRKAEGERIAKLPAAEQQKILEKERKRALRKSQSKITTRK